MKYSNKTVARLARQGRRINRHYRFWCWMCKLLKWGPYGFAIWRLESCIKAGQVYDRQVAQCQKEERRALAIARKQARH